MILANSVLENVLSAALENGADFAELFLEDSYTSSLEMRDSQLTNAVVGKNYGAGLRLFYGFESIYTYTNDLSERALVDLARRASGAISASSRHEVAPLTLREYDSLQSLKVLPWELSKEKKISYLKTLDKEGRGTHSEISQVIPVIEEVYSKIQVANSEGLLAEESRQYTYAAVRAVAEEGGEKEVGALRRGFFGSSEKLEEIEFPQLAQEAADLAVRVLRAEHAPAGEMPVVIHSGFGGVIFHEACGHGLETTSVAKGASVFCDKLEEKIASDCVTAIDDGTIPDRWGSITMDDEGMPTQKTTLIEKGVLKSYLVDHMGSRQTGYARTGSGRRQNYKYAPTSRMRNTFIQEGESSLEEMIGDVDDGLYAKYLGGGSVNPGTGDYNFAVREAFLIKAGRIDKRVKGASLIGRGIETLGKIQKVGRGLELSDGFCGSVSGSIPVTVGQPPILVSSLTVGGRS